MTSTTHRPGRRHDILEQLRASRGQPRHLKHEDSAQMTAHVGAYLDAFIRRAATGELDAPSTAVEADKIEEALKNIRKGRRAKPHPLDPASPDGSADISPANRRQLLQEIGSEHFRTHMHQWIGSVNADHELSSTPIEELEQVRSEIAYRLSVLKAMTDTSHRELEVLDQQIRARRIIDEQADADAASNRAREPGIDRHA